MPNNIEDVKFLLSKIRKGDCHTFSPSVKQIFNLLESGFRQNEIYKKYEINSSVLLPEFDNIHYITVRIPEKLIEAKEYAYTVYKKSMLFGDAEEFTTFFFGGRNYNESIHKFNVTYFDFFSKAVLEILDESLSLTILFNLYLKNRNAIKPQIKHALDKRDIEDMLAAIENGEREYLMDGRLLDISDLVTIKIFDASKSQNKFDKPSLKNELQIMKGVLQRKGLDLLSSAGKEVTDQFNIVYPKKKLNMTTQSDSEKKIFISHASKDANIIKPLLNLIEGIGIKESQIFFSSHPSYGVPLGEDIFDVLKKELSNNNVLGLFLLSENFYSSPICLCEMGAVWIKSNKQIPILIPPFDFKDIKGVFPNSLGFMINDKNQLNMFKATVEHFFSLTPINITRWEEKREEYLEKVNSFITS